MKFCMFAHIQFEADDLNDAFEKLRDHFHALASSVEADDLGLLGGEMHLRPLNDCPSDVHTRKENGPTSDTSR
jgi:hypothetical protein